LSISRSGREVRRFIWSCLRDRDTDQVEGFIAQHARDPVEDVCFIPVLSLTVGQEFTVGSIRLPPADAPELPVEPGGSIRAVAAVAVGGTNTNAMVDRARAVAERELRRRRIALRENNWVHGAQLRFRLGPQFALVSGPSGWTAPADVSWDLELYDDLARPSPTTQRRAGTINPELSSTGVWCARTPDRLR